MIADADTYRFSVPEYHRLAEVGILGNRDRIELLNGELVIMSPIGKRHAKAIRKLIRALTGKLNDQCIVDCQYPFIIGDYSEPQPDILLLKLEMEESDELPRPEDVLLVVGIVDSSLEYDRGAKLAAYAVSGVREVWILNIRDTVIECFRELRSNSYSEIRIVRPGESLSVTAFPDVTFGAVELLP